MQVQLEKRPAAVLGELARHRRTTVGECLEKTLLQSFESVPHDGVDSPHTSSGLVRTAALKEKHGTDYDTHGSYRLVEK